VFVWIKRTYIFAFLILGSVLYFLQDSFANSTDYETWKNQPIQLIPTIQMPPPKTGEIGILMTNSNNLIGTSAMHDLGYLGSSYTVAIIDTGVDYNHSDLAGRYLGGYDYVNNDSNPMDDNGHGTHVAGIAVGSGQNTGEIGIAPSANFVALKVLAANGSGTNGMLESALQWVANNCETYNIVSVNMSLGGGNYASSFANFLDDEFSSIINDCNATIIAASGNSYYSYGSAQGIAFPAVVNPLISVGAVYNANYGSITYGSGARDNTTAADRVTSFTQRSANLNILAPGAIVNSLAVGGGTVGLAGTSMAAPIVAGAVALLYEALNDINRPDLANHYDIKDLMIDHSVSVYDGDDENYNVTASNRSYPRLDFDEIIEQLNLLSAPPSPSSSPSVSPSISPSSSVSPSVSPSRSPSPSISVSPSASPSASVSASPSRSPSATPSVSPSNSPSASVSATPSNSPSISVSPSVSPSMSASQTPSPSISISPSISPSNSASPSPSSPNEFSKYKRDDLVEDNKLIKFYLSKVNPSRRTLNFMQELEKILVRLEGAQNNHLLNSKDLSHLKSLVRGLNKLKNLYYRAISARTLAKRNLLREKYSQTRRSLWLLVNALR
jgi:subtilisin family serine protease